MRKLWMEFSDLAYYEKSTLAATSWRRFGLTTSRFPLQEGPSLFRRDEGCSLVFLRVLLTVPSTGQ